MSRADDGGTAERRTDRLAPWRSVRLFFHYLRFNTLAGMEYRASFVVQVLGMVLNNSAFIVFWVLLFRRIGGAIAGYEISDVMFLWALGAAGYGIAGIAMGNAGYLSRLIYTGDLDVYLLQPKPLVPNIVASRMSIAAWGDLIYGVVLFLVSQPLSLLTISLFLVFTLLSSLLFTALRIAYHSISFFLGNAEEFAATASEMTLSFTLYPGSIFEGPTVWILHSLLPAALLAYIPVRLIRSFDLETFALLLAGDAAIVVASLLLFHAGLKRYESGNRIGTRT
jgi:ABC-2 type transport system permease protein